MNRLVFFYLVIGLVCLSACSLAADVTPPPGLENAQVETSGVEEVTGAQTTSEPEAVVEPASAQMKTSDDLAIEPMEAITGTLGMEPLEQTGVITGIVTNASDGIIPAGIDVILHGFDQMQMVLTETVKLAADGIFVFDRVPLKPGRAFIASLNFEGISYASNIAVAEEGLNSLELPMEIYESTSDPTGLIIDRLHVFFEAVDDQTIRVIELYVISNPGKKAVVPAAQDKPALNIALPQGATSLEFREGELGMRFVSTQDGFGDLAVIRPGMASHQVVFKYELPFNRKLVFSHLVYLPVNAVVVLVPEDSLKMKGELLQDAGTRSTDGFIYRTYNGSALAEGSQLSMEVNKRSTFSRPILTSGSSSGLVLGLLVLAVTLIAAGVWFFQRNRKAAPQAHKAQKTPGSEVEETQDSLMDAILALDDQYKSGKIPEGAYQGRRAELKERLNRLIQ